MKVCDIYCVYNELIVTLTTLARSNTNRDGLPVVNVDK